MAPGSRDDGVPHPGIFLVNASGVVRERFFEEHYWNRMTMRAVFSRLGREMPMAPASVDREHLKVLVNASDAAVHPGNRFTLFVDVIPLAGVHVYGPEVGGGCQGLAVQIEPLPYLTVHAPRYPEAPALNLAWTDEALTGYRGPVRMAIDVSLGTRQETAAVRDAGRGVAIGGTVRLQA